MKKVCSLIVALLLAVCCFGASAETVTVTAHMDENILASLLAGAVPPEQNDALMSTVTAFMDALSFKTVAVQDAGAQVDIQLKGQTIATVSIAAQGDQMVIVSDLFPNYAITATPEELQAIAQTAGTSAAGTAVIGTIGGADGPTNIFTTTASGPALQINGQTVTEEQVNAYVESFLAKLEAYQGEAVPGEYTFEETAFQVMTPVNMTVGDAMNGMLAILNDVAPDSEMTKNLSGTIAEAPAETMAIPMDIKVYSDVDAEGNPGENRYLTASMTMNDGSLFSSALITNEKIHLNVAIGEAELTDAEAVMAAAQSGQSTSATVLDVTIMPGVDEGSFVTMTGLYNGGMYVGLGVDCGQTPTPWMNMALNFPVPGLQFLVANTAFEEGGEITMPASTDGKAAISLTTLADGTDAEALNAFSADVMQNGVANLKAKVQGVMSDEYASLVELYNAFVALNMEEPAA